MDREDRELRYLKKTTVQKGKRKMEQEYEGGGWPTILPRFQDGTKLSRTESRYSLQWSFIYYCTIYPSCYRYCDPFTAEKEFRCKKGGGVVSFRNNILKKEWVEI